ncbi:hypothetical protein [Burkholderia ubonensis]|uniref:hypothetical protein n=1 Tax=Burkholderia ubonensis TaxID=101571 RepID=UPI000A79CDFB|nr:hypothetical protein [Burkholderia ubonensis]
MAWLLVRNNSIVMSGRYLREPAWTPSEQFNQSLLEKNDVLVPIRARSVAL